MILKYTYEDKFIDGKLSIGFGFEGKEITLSNFRIELSGNKFNKIGKKYINKETISSEHGIFEWGLVDEIYCFYDGERVATESIPRRRVTNSTMVSFFPKHFELTFNE